LLAVAVVVLTAIATVLSTFVGEDEVKTSRPVAENATGPRPKIVIEGDLTHEFGVMSQQKKDKHTWKIKNEGEGPLEIWQDGNTTCSCTVASLGEGKKALIKPGESTTIDLDWNTKTFENDYKQSANIGTNDPDKPRFTLAVKGKVFPPIKTFPSSNLTFNPFSNEESTEAKVAIVSPDRPDFKILGIESSRPNLITTKVVPLTEKDQKMLEFKGGYRIDVILKAGMPQGTFHDELVVKLDHPMRPEVKLTLAGHVNGPISLLPDRFRMPKVFGRAGASQHITLMVRGGRETRFEVADKPSKVEVSIVSTADDEPKAKGRYRLSLTVPAGTSSGAINGEVVLKTDHPQVPDLKVPVNIFVSNSDPG
jgi:uncharacterized cupredoxin-like copper-binding protein